MRREILQMNEVNFSYSNKLIFKNFSATFHTAEVVAVLGANGTGKTTLIKLLNGLLRPQKGKIIVNGKPIPKKVSDVAKTISSAFQNPTHQFFTSSVKEELRVSLQLSKKINSNFEQALNELAQQFYLIELLERSPFSLSSGEQRRLAIAAIIALDSSLVALDEPTAGQDVIGRKLLRTILTQLKRKGRGIIVTTHDVEWIIPIADRIIILQRNQTAIEIPISELLSSYKIFQSNGVRVPQLIELGSYLGLKSVENYNLLEEEIVNIVNSRLS